MKGIVTEFNLTGESVVDVNLICKKWNNKFGINVYTNSDDSVKYTLLIAGRAKGSYSVKTQISEAQALELKERLSLVTVKDSFFRRSSLIVNKDYVASEIERVTALLEDKRREYNMLSNHLDAYQSAK